MQTILHDISWDIREGEHTVLIGPDGAGKTSLLRLIRGEAWTRDGRISWYEDGNTPDSSRITGLGMTALVSPELQQRFQCHHLGLYGNDLLRTGFSDMSASDLPPCDVQERRIAEIVRELDCEKLLNRPIRALSQGQLRILLLGRALIRKPRLLLLDECMDGLDEKHRLQLESSLERIARESTIIMTTHREYRTPAWLGQRRYIAEGRLVDGPATPGASVSSRSEEITLAKAPERTGDPLIEIKNATVYLEGAPTLLDLNWSLYPGERWLLDGENGSGKSTFLRLLAGDENVAWPGQIIYRMPGSRAGEIDMENRRRQIRLVSDLGVAFYSHPVTCLELVLTGFDNTVGLFREPTRAELDEAMDILEQMELSRFSDSSIRGLSTGQERRLFLARAMVGSPSVLLLDEPCSGLDDRARDRYLGFLDRVTSNGLQYIFVSHYREDAPASANRMAHMEEGRLTILK